MKPKGMNLPLAWLGTIVASVAIGYGIFRSGVDGDCKPHEVDGQCGLSSFVGLVDGVLVGFVIFATIAVYLSIEGYKRRQAPTQQD